MINRISAKIKKEKRKMSNRILSVFRRHKLSNKDFTIISNNCWGGLVYRYFGLEYASPTVGLYFYADDYINFCSNLKVNLSAPITFIDVDKSKHRDDLIRKGQNNIPIGLINDIEIMFLHYKTEQEAKEKWERRCKRVNFDNLIVKFSYMNNPKPEHMKSFDLMKFKKRLMFVKNKEQESLYASAFYYPGYEQSTEISNDTDHFSRYIDLYKLINRS